jgi:hypothetical protein
MLSRAEGAEEGEGGGGGEREGEGEGEGAAAKIMKEMPRSMVREELEEGLEGGGLEGEGLEGEEDSVGGGCTVLRGTRKCQEDFFSREREEEGGEEEEDSLALRMNAMTAESSGMGAWGHGGMGAGALLSFGSDPYIARRILRGCVWSWRELTRRY